MLFRSDRFAATLKAFNGVADGMVLINAPGRRIVDRDGGVYFGKGRERAGVMGAAIKPRALRAVKEGVALIERYRLKLEVIAVGGITTVADVREFIDAGACAAQAATAAMFNPHLAIEVKSSAPEV